MELTRYALAGNSGELQVAEGGQELCSKCLLVGAQGRGLVGIARASADDAGLRSGEPLLGGLGEGGAVGSAQSAAVQGGLGLGAPGAVRRHADGHA